MSERGGINRKVEGNTVRERGKKKERGEGNESEGTK